MSLWSEWSALAEVMASEGGEYLDRKVFLDRSEQVRTEINESGTYVHTAEELEFGARLAWRNSNRCIGRHLYRSLDVVDCRHATSTEQVTTCLKTHVERATNGGKIQSTISIFAARAAGAKRPDPVRVGNHQLIRYAGFSGADGEILGDPHSAEFTTHCLERGWRPSRMDAFTPLPWSIWIEGKEQPPYDFFAESPEALLEVAIRHPEFETFDDLGLKWYAVPILSDMALVVGGIVYPCAPFNGWYMGTEIGSRNFADSARYNVLGHVADRLNMDRSSERTLWRDRATVELNRAVLHSFDTAGVTVDDHHELGRRFDRFRSSVKRKGSDITGDWSWLVPPITASQSPQFHQEFDNTVCQHTNFFYQRPIWSGRQSVDASPNTPSCPFTLHTKQTD